MRLTFKENPLKLIRSALVVTSLLIFGVLLYIFVLTNYFHSINYGKGTLYYNFNKGGECSLEIDGKINGSLEDAFHDILKKSEQYDCKSYRLSLNSGGGNMAIAMRLGDIIKSKDMTTIVLDKCKSSCMYLFISGKTRIASKHSVLGMHQPRNLDTGECTTLTKISRNNTDSLREHQQYIDARLGTKAGEFYANKDNLASCNEMLQIDNEEFLKEGIITELAN